MKYTTKHIDNYVVIVSDEEIKDCDLVINSSNGIFNVINSAAINNEIEPYIYYKIIAQSKFIHPNIPVFDIPVEWGVGKLEVSFKEFVESILKPQEYEVEIEMKNAAKLPLYIPEVKIRGGKVKIIKWEKIV